MKPKEFWIEYEKLRCGVTWSDFSSFIDRIQTDARKSGYTEAAELIFPTNIKHDGTEKHKRILNRDFNTIITARDKITNQYGD
jgi:hypothetical protein